MIKRSLTYFLYFAIFLIPFYIFRVNFGPIKTNIFEISVFISFLIFLILQLKDRSKIVWPPIQVIIFLGLVLTSALFSTDKTEALGILKGWFLSPAILYFLIINSDIKNQKILKVFFAGLALVLTWALLQKMSLITTLFYQRGDETFDQYLDGNRLFGPFESPNFLAMFLVPALFLSINLFKKKSYQALLIFAVLIMVFLTGSQAGIFSLVFAVVIWLFLRAKKPQLKVLPLILVIVWPILNLAYLYFFPFLKLGDEREKIYQYSLDLLYKFPLSGIGLGNFQERIREVGAADPAFNLYVLPYALHPHNLFLNIWLSLGLLGLLAFLALIFVYLRKMVKLKDYKLKASLLVALFAILFHGFFDTTYFKNDLSSVFWLLLALSHYSSDE